jgi:sulfoxide reductase heme-binding subunit YedZ
VAHYYWLVKSDIRQPMLYGTLVALLLCWRLVSRAIRNTAPRRA